MISLLIIILPAYGHFCVEKVHDFWCATENCTASVSFESLHLCGEEFKIQVGGTAASFYDDGLERYSWTEGSGRPWVLSVTHYVTDVSTPYVSKPFTHSSSIKSANGFNSPLHYNGVKYLVYGRITYSSWLTHPPTEHPTVLPTISPTQNPTETPTNFPTPNPTRAPTVVPTQNPTAIPTSIPTENPTKSPTPDPTAHPTRNPTVSPTSVPTASPTLIPTRAPTAIPSQNPTARPTTVPTENPTNKPGIGASGDSNYCSPSRKCSLGQGDCDKDSHCAAGLICGRDNCKQFHPNALAGHDCCIRKLTLTSRFKSPYVNTWDKDVNYHAGSDGMITGFFSVHHNRREDRRYGFYSAAARGVSCKPKDFGPYVNQWDKTLEFICSQNHALFGVYSIHSNKREDRRWKFRCCAVSSNAYLRREEWTGYKNNWDKRLDYTCKLNRVVVGVSSYHHNRKEDRRWKFLCAELKNKL